MNRQDITSLKNLLITIFLSLMVMESFVLAMPLKHRRIVAQFRDLLRQNPQFLLSQNDASLREAGLMTTKNQQSKLCGPTCIFNATQIVQRLLAQDRDYKPAEVFSVMRSRLIEAFGVDLRFGLYPREFAWCLGTYMMQELGISPSISLRSIHELNTELAWIRAETTELKIEHLPKDEDTALAFLLVETADHTWMHYLIFIAYDPVTQIIQFHDPLKPDHIYSSVLKKRRVVVGDQKSQTTMSLVLGGKSCFVRAIISTQMGNIFS